MGISKLLRTIRPHFNNRRSESIRRSSCGNFVPTPRMRFRSPFRGSLTVENLDTFLDTRTLHVDLDDYMAQDRISSKCPIQKVHASQLAANNPIEDRWNCGFIQTNEEISKFVFSVVDGHSGSSCSHALAWIVLEYIAATLVGPEDLDAAVTRLASLPSDCELPPRIVEQPTLYNNKGKNVTKRFLTNRLPPPDIRKFLIERLVIFMQELKLSPLSEKHCWEEALMRLDSELCSLGLGSVSALSEATENPFTSTTTTAALSADMLRVAQSGAVGVFGLLDWNAKGSDGGGVELQIANVGDCSAVLFSTFDDSGELKPRRLTTPHNGSTNIDELRRLMLEHPDDKAEDLIRNGGRLLGELAPTRAFGDVRYKWTNERLRQMADYLGATADSTEMTAGSWAGLEALPTPYTSPPYLTAKPEVTTCMLNPSDRYLVLATDGLWDTLSPERAALILSRLHPDQCPATRLMRAALSLTPTLGLPSHRGMAKEDFRLASLLLALPPGVARLYRDDITLVVVELNAPPASCGECVHMFLFLPLSSAFSKRALF
ncbi:[Pyruvate dehydrogenase [acetyl-transferring]]-phosphatase 2, mitochondrial [Echinococcus granulosus]|uniref:Pyruvate dehydrogenase n=1 Tax=Echinococcus granulosus TaxID=6210 RepID=A0A068WSJ6_ECHGR|nr:[Pyruvate dehydrogenase [acetyl-transferring]]-phosphatase 2, mitochondrial [Echinococcus granulosus]CDS21442.1 pyruvate dehydrogenase [Echinococcus granulosus]